MAVNNLKEIEKKLKEVGAVPVGKMEQHDTYYNNNDGRLKIREIGNQTCEIIFYQRPDRINFKVSDYSIETVPKDQCKNIKLLYSKTYGEKVIVSKVRNLWLINNTRIHLDKVKNLGNFLELETVVKGKMLEAKNEFNSVVGALKLANKPQIKGSYCDILLRKPKMVG